MDASVALSDLLALSTQVVEAVVTGTDGRVEAAHTSGEERTKALAGAGAELLSAASSLRASGTAVERVHVDLERGSLVAVADGERSVVATTVPEPTVGLVAYDLRALLTRLRGEAS
jgi:predicted regulator of Ras-like GTPase activity (Roadblock/LC7/MglB family)